MNSTDNILNRIDELLEKNQKGVSLEEAAEVALAVTNIFETVYGPRSPQLELLEKVRKQVYENKNNRHGDEYFNARLFVQHLHGYLRTLKSDIKEGRVNIQSQIRGEILGDFLSLAHETLNAGQKDVAAVLACAALEDVLKRCASDRGLEVQKKNMQTVVNALKSKSIINSSQGKVLDGYVQVRNDTFHARWEAIDIAVVKGIIGYTQGFLAEQSASPIPADVPADTPAES